jgi:hypothetical protein
MDSEWSGQAYLRRGCVYEAHYVNVENRWRKIGGGKQAENRRKTGGNQAENRRKPAELSMRMGMIGALPWIASKLLRHLLATFAWISH